MNFHVVIIQILFWFNMESKYQINRYMVYMIIYIKNEIQKECNLNYHLNDLFHN